MASPYTCRACARALLRSSPKLPSITTTPRLPAPTLRILPSPTHTTRRNASTAPRTSPKPPPPTAPAPRTATDHKPAGISSGLAAKVRKAMPLTTETYAAYGATEDLIKECARQGEYSIPQARERGAEIPTDATGAHLGVGEGWWFDDLGLPATFINWSQITFIHMYMLQVRFRMLPETHSGIWIQHLTNHMFYAAEDRLVVWHRLDANSLRQKHLKDLFAQWRATLMSYDEGLVKGDAEMAAAVWRNLFGGNPEFADYERLAQIVGYMRREIRRLELASDDEVASGEWKFESNPGTIAEMVAKPSLRMKQGEKA